MSAKIYVVTDLGPGDGGKGGVVHKIATLKKAHTVIKDGGAQGSHGVMTSRGEKFAFSLWGCGTFDGVRTHISKRMIITPVGLLNEADVLRRQYGFFNPFDLLTIDERAVCANSFHGILSRLKELARGLNPRGTVGVGVGEAFRYANVYPELIIRAGDLGRTDLKDRLIAVREQVRRDVANLDMDNYLVVDREGADREKAKLFDEGFLDYVYNVFREVWKRAKIVDAAYLEKEILTKDGVAVIERSHGILTDHYQGFHPHVSAIRTLPSFAHGILEEFNFSGQVVNLAVHRAYSIRHGAGPMPTDHPEMAEDLLPGSHTDNDRYRGQVRVGPLDLVMLRYAIEVCGGPQAFDGMALTWFDQIVKNGAWSYCDRYYFPSGAKKFFVSPRQIKVRFGNDNAQIRHQEKLAAQLQMCVPDFKVMRLEKSLTREELYEICKNFLQEKIGIPVRMVSFGPTELDKLCK